jgi:uracil-DNA glycosylase family 4
MSGEVHERLRAFLEDQAAFGPLTLPADLDPAVLRNASALRKAWELRDRALPASAPLGATVERLRQAPVTPRPEVSQPALAPLDLRWQGLQEVHAAAEACRACDLGSRRNTCVFGMGPLQADLVIVGEAPGEQEDQQGEPFVGAAGQLLDKMMAAIGFARQDLYICNTLKCRPPGNRDPLPGELAACRSFLDHQLHFLQPRLILALGRVAGRALLGQEGTLAAMRGSEHRYRGLPLRISYHPAALLRNAQWKRPAWEDLQAMRRRYDELGGRPGTLPGA